MFLDFFPTVWETFLPRGAGLFHASVVCAAESAKSPRWWVSRCFYGEVHHCVVLRHVFTFPSWNDLLIILVDKDFWKGRAWKPFQTHKKGSPLRPRFWSMIHRQTLGKCERKTSTDLKFCMESSSSTLFLGGALRKVSNRLEIFVPLNLESLKFQDVWYVMTWQTSCAILRLLFERVFVGKNQTHPPKQIWRSNTAPYLDMWQRKRQLLVALCLLFVQSNPKQYFLKPVKRSNGPHSWFHDWAEFEPKDWPCWVIMPWSPSSG